jgi:excisionase family DNA binding protein
MNRAELEHLLAPYPTMLTVDEVATVLRVHPRSIQRWAREGRVPSVRVGRSYRIARADVVRWMLDASSASDTAAGVSPSSATPSS